MINAFYTHELLRKQFVDGIGELVPTRSAPICN